jgi:hypothetical protein
MVARMSDGLSNTVDSPYKNVEGTRRDYYRESITKWRVGLMMITIERLLLYRTFLSGASTVHRCQMDGMPKMESMREMIVYTKLK